MTTKKDGQGKVPSLTKVVKASPAPAKSIDKPAPARVSPGKLLQLEVKVQTAEGWKREMRKKFPNKKVSKN